MEVIVIAAKPPIEKEHADALREWKAAYIGYGVAHYVLVLLGIIAGGIVAAIAGVSTTTTTSESVIHPAWTMSLGIVAAVSVAITNQLDTGSKYKRFNKAWCILNEAVIRYRTQPDFLIEKVTNALVTGENVINEIPSEKRSD